MPTVITSKDNEKIKLLRKLSLKKHRIEENMFLVENAKIIHDSQQTKHKAEALFITATLLSKNDKTVESILKNTEAYFIIDEKINKSFSNLDTPSGICAVYSIPTFELNLAESVIYLNAINDPGNLGTIIRTALAFGFTNVVLDEECADLYNPKTINSAKDAIFKVSTVKDLDLSLLKQIKKKMPIISTRLENARELSEFTVKKPFCLVFGSEAHGVSKDIQVLSDHFLSIKLSNEIESLNVAISAGIILHKLN